VSETYEEAIGESIRTGDRRMREGFIRSFDRDISAAPSPAAAREIQRRYLRQCRHPLERAQILRYGEMITMWETAE